MEEKEESSESLRGNGLHATRGLGEERGARQIPPHHLCTWPARAAQALPSKSTTLLSVTAMCVAPAKSSSKKLGPIVLGECDTQNCHRRTPDTVYSRVL